MAAIPTETAVQPATWDPVRSLVARLGGLTELVHLRAALASGRHAAADRVVGSSCALVAAALAEDRTTALLVTLPREEQVDELAAAWPLLSDLPLWLFPAFEQEAHETRVGDDAFGRRLKVVKELAFSTGPDGRSPSVIVASIEALLQPTPSRAAIQEQTRRIAVGSSVEAEPVVRWLTQRGYAATPAVELPGEFSLRGGILDLFPVDFAEPVRIELWGDEVESIRRFDIASQRSLERLDAIELAALDPTDRGDASLLEHLPDNAWVVLHEPQQLEQRARQWRGHLERPEAVHGYSETIRRLLKRPALTTASLLAGQVADVQETLPLETVERFSGELAKVRGELEQLAAGDRVCLVAPTEAELKRVREIFHNSPLLADGRLDMIVGRLAGGFRFRPREADDGVILLSAGELFSRQTKPRGPRVRRRLTGKAIESFLDLREGDLVVHLVHGIARYRGLKKIEKQEQVEEHLELEFAKRTRIYVPATKIDLVQKYVGGSKTRPPLSIIGGKTWQRQKRAAESAVSNLAGELLELQAARQARPGISYGADTPWQAEFDAAFPYEETPDQLTAIAAIKEDLESGRPMDRLLCGDVGFGKTEVAMRAAFKAVDNGFQVAVLVPTTILAEQHYQTFRDRMAEFPFTIGKLSRFASAADQKDTLARLASGGVDIVIGTHRVASRDVQFANLGLLIIDEEQRFGVAVKERLKSLRSTVDVLTLSATPIPRTLHMSLVGMRDISNLETPPEERMAVETQVVRFDEELIRHAIDRELARGGQIFFVHNRVNDIHGVAARIKQICPDVRLKIGHGQMPEEQLEEVMVEFVHHDFDLLLATTIVESGLDIPNANTIFVDEADRYGLSDLHQLRGRVGRYKHRAYCYLLLDPHKSLTPQAARRLHAIEEFSEMGAGFAISMRDLEIRGAGNLLGSQQSGHIAAVGYELYCQLLENAVRRRKQLPPKTVIDVTIDLPGEAYIPEPYTGDLRTKIDLYRRLANVADRDALTTLRTEVRDRFGEPPPPVERLFALADLKLDAAAWEVHSIDVEDQFLRLAYSSRRKAEQLAAVNRRRVRIVDDKTAYVPLKAEAMRPDLLLQVAKLILQAG